MYKTLFTVFFLLLQINTFAQWKKILGKGGLPSHSGVTFSKHKSVIVSSGTNKLYLCLRKQNGQSVRSRFLYQTYENCPKYCFNSHTVVKF